MTFLVNHVGETWGCDFVQTYDLFFRTVFVYFIVELGSRRVVHYGVTQALIVLLNEHVASLGG